MKAPDTCSITCTHGLGLKCRVCYDQRFGLDWKPEGTLTGRLSANIEHKSNTPKEGEMAEHNQTVLPTTVNGVKAVSLTLTVSHGAFSYSRFAIGKWPASDEYQWLMGLLEGHDVLGTAFSPTNLTGHTDEGQLRRAFASLSADTAFYIKEPQLDAVITKFGSGELGFHMGGMYCEQTPQQIKALVSDQLGPDFFNT